MIEFATSKFFKESKKIKTLQTNRLSSKCQLIELDNKIYVTKFIGKQFGGLSIKKVEQLNLKCVIYYQKLKTIGVPVPSFFRNYIQMENTFKEALLVNVNKYCGQSLSSIVKQSKLDEYLLLVKQVIDSIKIVISNNFKHGVSLDPNLANFVADDKLRVTYVDFCPPLVKESESGLKIWRIRRIDELNQDSKIKDQRYFSIKGLLLLFVVRAWSTKVEYEKYLINIFQNFVEELKQNQKYIIKQSIFYQILTMYLKNLLGKNFLIKITRQSKQIDRDLLRLIFLTQISKRRTLNKSQQIEIIFRKYKSPSKFQDFQRFLLKELA